MDAISEVEVVPKVRGLDGPGAAAIAGVKAVTALHRAMLLQLYKRLGWSFMVE